MKTFKGFVEYLRENQHKIDQKNACYVDSLDNKCCVLAHAAIYFEAERVPFRELEVLRTYPDTEDFDILQLVPEDKRRDSLLWVAGYGHEALLNHFPYENDSLEGNIFDTWMQFEELDDVFSAVEWPAPAAEVFQRAFPELL